jgi:hypothetical protein
MSTPMAYGTTAIGEQDASDRHPVAGMRVRHQGDVPDRERPVRQVGRLLERGAFDVERPTLDRHPAGLANPRQGGDGRLGGAT